MAEGPLEVTPNALLKQGQQEPAAQDCVQAPSELPPKGEDSMAFPSNLCQCLVTLTVKKNRKKPLKQKKLPLPPFQLH